MLLGDHLAIRARITLELSHVAAPIDKITIATPTAKLMNGEDCIFTSSQSLIFIRIGLSFMNVLPWAYKVDTRNPRSATNTRGLRLFMTFIF